MLPAQQVVPPECLVTVPAFTALMVALLNALSLAAYAGIRALTSKPASP